MAVLDAGRALVVAVNKWDGLSDYQRSQVEALLSRKLAFVPWAEAVRISAMHGSGLRELFRAIHRAHDSATRKFSTAEVTRALEIAYETNPPPRSAERRVGNECVSKFRSRGSPDH